MDSVWLIAREDDDGDIFGYFCGGFWSNDCREAIRFVRGDDANAMIQRLRVRSEGKVIAVEHEHLKQNRDEEMDRLKSRIIDLEGSLKQAWPDGSETREQWMSKVWNFIPLSVLSKACILAKEARGPFYLPFMEPPGWTPQADFTCWICGINTPHSHSPIEVDAARKTLSVFHENVWQHLCRSASGKIVTEDGIRFDERRYCAEIAGSCELDRETAEQIRDSILERQA
jgi:hypothetical protein